MFWGGGSEGFFKITSQSASVFSHRAAGWDHSAAEPQPGFEQAGDRKKAQGAQKTEPQVWGIICASCTAVL